MIRLQIVCDNCGIVGGEATTEMGRPPKAHLVRSELSFWRQGVGGSDWCPHCWLMLKRAKRLQKNGKLTEETDSERTARIVDSVLHKT